MVTFDTSNGILIIIIYRIFKLIKDVLVVKSVISAMLGSFRILLSVHIMRYRLERFHTMKDQTVFPVVNASTIGRGFSKIYKLILLSELRKQRR